MEVTIVIKYVKNCVVTVTIVASKHIAILVDTQKFTTRYSRKLLSTVEWEKCDFEIGFARNYSQPASDWKTPAVAYLWIILYVFLTFTVFVGKNSCALSILPISLYLLIIFLK